MSGLQSDKLLGASPTTAAATADMSGRAIMRQTGHKSSRVLEWHIREGSLFRENAAANVGLYMWLVTRMAGQGLLRATRLGGRRLGSP